MSKTGTSETPSQRKARIKKHYAGIGTAVGGATGVYIGRYIGDLIVMFVLATILGMAFSAIAGLIVEKKMKG